MKKKLIVLITLFLILVVWLAPATLINKFLPTNKNIAVSGLHGTIWSGSIGQLNANGWNFKALDYTLDVLPLFVGNMGGSVLINKGDIEGNLEFSITGEQSLLIEEASIETEARLFESFLPIPGIGLNGNVSTVDFSIQIENKRPILLSGITNWSDATVDITNNLFELGQFQIDWQTNPNTGLITGKVVKTTNALALKGNVTLDQTGLLEFKGSISSKTQNAIYNAFLLFADGKVSKERLPIKFKKKL